MGGQKILRYRADRPVAVRVRVKKAQELLEIELPKIWIFHMLLYIQYSNLVHCGTGAHATFQFRRLKLGA